MKYLKTNKRAIMMTIVKKRSIPLKGGSPNLNLIPENPVLKEIFETQTETDIFSAKFLKT